MNETIPVLLTFLAGTAITAITNVRGRATAGALVVLVTACVSTIASGEYRESWIYLLQDGGEAGIGLVLGFLAAQWGQTIWARRRSA